MPSQLSEKESESVFHAGEGVVPRGIRADSHALLYQAASRKVSSFRDNLNYGLNAPFLFACRGVLLRCYTQNIDGLEELAGIPREKIVQAHGGFDSARCIDCKHVGDPTLVLVAFVFQVSVTVERVIMIIDPS